MEKSLTVEAVQSSTIVNFVTLGSTGWYSTQDRSKWRVGRAQFCRVVCKSVFSGVFLMVYQQGGCEVCAPFIEADISQHFGGT